MPEQEEIAQDQRGGVVPGSGTVAPKDVKQPAEQPLGFFYRREGRNLVAWVAGVIALAFFVICIFYLRLSNIIDAKLAAGPFSGSIDIFTEPRTLAVGDALTLEELVSGLRRSGYTTSHSNPLGWYNVRPQTVEVFPGRDSYAGGEPAVLEFANGKVSRLVFLQDNTARKEIRLEPQLIANLSENREKRRLVRYADIPPALVHAVISAEDKHFFHHTGFDFMRMLKAAYVDVKDGRKEQGASTLSMQLARGLWLDSDKHWKRKVEELLMTMHMEHKLTKQQIFEYYSNQVYLGRSGSFSINGFGEGARVFFGKDISQLTTSEAALLAGLVQRPSYFNPYRYPDRARDRRDIVLGLMRENGYLDQTGYQAALGTPVRISAEHSVNMESQYFVDLMSDELQAKLDDHDKQTRYVYSTLDPDLQQAAEEAVTLGMENVDQQLRKAKSKEPVPRGQPQVALIALDPHTGEIRALVGGRNYGSSQLNHVIAMRQPGSVFKPFVYAAALDTAVQGGRQIFTAASTLEDEPTSFQFAGRQYQPGNFGHEFMGDVTMRTALAHSLNVATVSLAQQVGYANVVSMARRAGLNDGIKPTPSMALGSYETTPLEIAGAYTVFANHGTHVTPSAISLVRAPDGHVIYQHKADPHVALDPRVAYLMVNLMQEVLRSGTGAGVRSRGFSLPAAGKTGTSHDGWFAGFTTELLCVVWVGFDDNRELNLEGARSALPIWAEFMKRASKFRQYRDAKAFPAPPGVVSADICSDSGELAGPYCLSHHPEVFIDGTQPVVDCQLHSVSTQQFADRVAEPAPPPAAAPLLPRPPGGGRN